MRSKTGCSRADALDVRTNLAILVLFIAAGAVVKDYLWGSFLFASVVALSFAVGRAKMEALLSAVTPEIFALIAVVTFAGGVVGALLGRAVFKKHFERAGVA